MNTSSTPASADLQALARRRVDIKMGFLGHLCVFVAVNGGLALLHAASSGSFHVPFPVWGWGIGLLAHGVGTAISLMGGSLRERMLSAELAALQKR